MENLWERMASVCGSRLGRHLGVVPAEDGKRTRAGRTVFALRWLPEARRLRTEELPETSDGDREAGGRTVAYLIVRQDQLEADQQPAASRAVLESRIVGQALATRAEEAPPGAELLERLPFPAPDPVFAEQLAILFRRAADGGEVGWAIERVIAELYALELEQLVAIQSRIGAEE